MVTDTTSADNFGTADTLRPSFSNHPGNEMKRAFCALLLASLATPALATPAVGTQQSPIDVRSGSTIYASMPTLNFSYKSDALLTLLNTGSPDLEKTVKATPSGSNSLSIDGTVYNLQQFHFHINCEHLLNGVASPMESHFVHQSDAGFYTVVGRFIELGDENLLLKPLFYNLPQAPDATFNINNFDLSALAPTDLRSYSYTGSLMTPGFNEGINWVIMEERLFLSQNQINAFKTLFPLPTGNFREIQPLNGRIVQTDVASFVPEPASWPMLIIGFDAVGASARRRRAVAMA